MKDFLEKFGLNEVLSHLFPGAIALFALLLWIAPAPVTVLGPELGKNDFVLSAAALIAAYAAGLIISSSALTAWDSAGRIPILRGPYTGWEPFLADRLKWATWKLIDSLAGLPSPETHLVLACNEITERLEGVFGLSYMALLRATDQCSILRSIATDRLTTKISAITSEAEAHRRRLLFSLGVALSLVVFGTSASLRLIVRLISSAESQFSTAASWRAGHYLAIADFAAFLLVATCVATTMRRRKVAGGQLLFVLAIFLALSAAGGYYLRGWGLLEALVLFLVAASVITCIRQKNSATAAAPLSLLFAAAIVATVLVIANLLPWQYLRGLYRWERSLPEISVWLLLFAAPGAFWLSWQLRKVAARCWEQEVAHSLAIVQLYGTYLG